MASQDWKDDCLRWRGVVLTGEHGHWCPDYDYLPIDETSMEWPCPCIVGEVFRQGEKAGKNSQPIDEK